MQQETSGGKKRGLLPRALDAIRGNRKLELMAYGGIVLLVIVLYAASLAAEPGAEGARAPETAASGAASGDAEAETEKKLAGVLSSIRGAGRVEVMITYETGTELVPAMSTKVDSDSSEVSDGDKNSTTVRVNEVSEPATMGGGGNEPIVLLERRPVVRGVIVVAEGAADIRVKLDLQRAVQAVLDIPLSDIEVFERSGVTSNQEGG